MNECVYLANYACYMTAHREHRTTCTGPHVTVETAPHDAVDKIGTEGSCLIYRTHQTLAV